MDLRERWFQLRNLGQEAQGGVGGAVYKGRKVAEKIGVVISAIVLALPRLMIGVHRWARAHGREEVVLNKPIFEEPVEGIFVVEYWNRFYIAFLALLATRAEIQRWVYMVVKHTFARRMYRCAQPCCLEPVEDLATRLIGLPSEVARITAQQWYNAQFENTSRCQCDTISVQHSRNKRWNLVRGGGIAIAVTLNAKFTKFVGETESQVTRGYWHIDVMWSERGVEIQRTDELGINLVSGGWRGTRPPRELRLWERWVIKRDRTIVHELPPATAVSAPAAA